MVPVAFQAQQFPTGWVKDPVKVKEMHNEWRQNRPIEFAQLGAKIIATDDNAPVFLFQGEQTVRGKQEGAWNQKSVGSCTGFGHGRAANDLMLWEIACGQPEKDPGADVCPEVIYGGSRVEIGGGQIGNSDGSLGAWCAQWLLKYGVALRGKYGNLDLTTYNETTCRALGRNGIPADLENIAKSHPVKDVAVVRSKEEAWAALGAGKPIAPCSDVGFDSPIDKNGVCKRSGTWPHCMAWRARFVHPDLGRCILNSNNWDDYLGTGWNMKIKYVNAQGGVSEFTLPPGHFVIPLDNNSDAVDDMTGGGDTHALAGLAGWEIERLTYRP